MRRFVGAVAALAMFGLAACSSTQTSTDVAKVQGAVTTVASQVESACGVAAAAASVAQPFAAVPAVGDILSFEAAACGTAPVVAGMVAKAVVDPTTVAWIENLATELNTAMADVKKI